VKRFTAVFCKRLKRSGYENRVRETFHLAFHEGPDGQIVLNRTSRRTQRTAARNIWKNYLERVEQLRRDNNLHRRTGFLYRRCTAFVPALKCRLQNSKIGADDQQKRAKGAKVWTSAERMRAIYKIRISKSR
jgi:hypothetical protein